ATCPEGHTRAAKARCRASELSWRGRSSRMRTTSRSPSRTAKRWATRTSRAGAWAPSRRISRSCRSRPFARSRTISSACSSRPWRLALAPASGLGGVAEGHEAHDERVTALVAALELHAVEAQQPGARGEAAEKRRDLCLAALGANAQWNGLAARVRRQRLDR